MNVRSAITWRKLVVSITPMLSGRRQKLSAISTARYSLPSLATPFEKSAGQISAKREFDSNAGRIWFAWLTNDRGDRLVENSIWLIYLTIIPFILIPVVYSHTNGIHFAFCTDSFRHTLIMEFFSLGHLHVLLLHVAWCLSRLPSRACIFSV